MGYKEEAFRLLKEAGGPMHVKDIIKEAKDKGRIQTTNSKAHTSLASMIIHEIKTQGENARFEKTGKNEFDLSPKGHKTEVTAETVPPPNGDQTKSEVSGIFTGPAGEARIQSELLFRGFEVSKPTPDRGVDIVATKNDQTFYIQVKTINTDKPPYSFTIRKDSFERANRPGTYYVFGIRVRLTGDMVFIVVPRDVIQGMITARKITAKTQKKVSTYQVIFTHHSGSFRCKGSNMDSYKNNWDL